MKFLKKVGVFLLVLAGILGLTGFIISHFYEDDVKAYAVARINQYLNTEVAVGDIELSLFSKFPNASLNFSEVTIHDAYPDASASADTLLYAEALFLKFNIMDLFGEQYTVTELDAENAALHLRVREDGADNYHFWKTPEDSTSGAFTFNLEDVAVETFDVTYDNMSNGQHYAFSESDVQLAGDFTAATFTLDGELSTEVDSFTARGINYVNSKHADLSFALAINTDSLTYAFKRGKLALEELLFDVSGQVATLDDGTLCDLAIKGNGIDVERLYSLLPPEFKGQLNRYNSQGKLTLDARITGLVNAKSNPTIAADFKVKNGRLEEKTTGLTLDHLAVEGSYNQTANKSEVLNLPVIYATLKDGDVTAAVKVRDFKHPRLDVTMHGELNLADVQDFLQIDTVDQLQGRVAFDTEFKGQASALQKFDRQYFKKAKTTGRLSFQDASLRFKNQTHGFEHVQGDFVLKNNDASIEHLSLNLAGSDFQLNGLFRNFMAFIFLPNEKLTIDAGLKANQVDLDQLLAATSGESTSDEAYHFRLPDYLNFKLRTAVDHLTFRRFEANDLRGTVLLRDKQLTAKKIRFKTMDGEIRSSGTIDGRKAPNYFAYCTADFKSIDIQKLFHTFEDFGQSFLQERHLRGSSNVFAEVGLAFSDDLTVDQDRLVSNIDIDIRDGELVGLETMQAISDYMASNKLITPLVKVDEFGKKLEHIYFERMTNRIEIKKRKVTIPSMAIKSSAMNINVAGTHTFDNAIDYKFNFRLADLLRKKSLDSEFGPIEDDGLGASLFLTMKGTIDSYVIRYDRSSARENFKEKMQHEKQDIKSILKEEFHLFNKDTSVKALPAEVEKAPEFVIEWEDENTNATTDPVKDPGSSKKPKEESKDPPKKKGKFKKFLDKLEENQKQEEQVTFEIEGN